MMLPPAAHFRCRSLPAGQPPVPARAIRADTFMIEDPRFLLPTRMKACMAAIDAWVGRRWPGQPYAGALPCTAIIDA